MDRQGLGDLWLCWYIHRSDPRRPFADVHLGSQGAQQLRVWDVVDDQRAWEAMSQPDLNAPHLNHVKGIEDYEQRYRDWNWAVLIVPALSVPEGDVVIDGSHRACALYRLAIEIDADVLAFPAPPGHPDAQPGLRSTVLSR
jgi:hypothetical protein